MSDDTGPVGGCSTNEYRIRKLEIATAVAAEKTKNMEDSMEKLTDAVNNLTDTMTQAKGGWRVIAGQGAFISVVVALALSVLEFFKGS